MTTTTTTAALIPVAPVFTNTERLALAGFLAGYSAPALARWPTQLGVVFRGGEHSVRRPLRTSNRSRGPADLRSPAQERYTALAWDQKRRRRRPSCGPGGPGCGERAGSTLNRHVEASNFGTYLAQRAAGSRLRPVSAGYPFDAQASA